MVSFLKSILLTVPWLLIDVPLDSTFSWSSLENNLTAYLSDPSAYSQPFDIARVPVVSKAEEQQEVQRK